MFNIYETFKKLDEIYLSEGTHYDKKAIQNLVNSGLFNEEVSTYIINALFTQDIHAFSHAPAWLEKYLLGIVNMLIKYCNGDMTKARVFLTDCPDIFENYLTYIKTIRPKLSEKERLALDNRFNNEMSFEDVKKELNEIQDELDKQSKAELANMKFENSQYSLVPINSFEEFNKKFGGHWTGDGSSNNYAGNGGTAWCHANNESVYYNWTRKGKFFVLAKNNWKDIHFNKESNYNNPKDEYGTSLIALLVSKTGILLNATLRCNHVGVNAIADNQYRTYSELSKVAMFNVEEAVKKYLPSAAIDYDKFDGSIESLDALLYEAGTFFNEIEEFYIPDGITEIRDGVFSGCRSLQLIRIPDSVTKIGSYAFEDCYSLRSIRIPDGVTKIGRMIFLDCDHLQAIYYSGKNSIIAEELAKYADIVNPETGEVIVERHNH